MAEERGFHLYDNAIPYVEGRIDSCNPFVKMQWRQEDDAPWQTIQTHLIGAYNISNLRAAITIGLYFGVTPEQICHAIENYIPSNSRSEFRDTGRNRLIVDAYNANPSSMGLAIDNLAALQASGKLALLGDMRELGEASVEEHRNIVRKLISAGIPAYLVGEEFGKALVEHPLILGCFPTSDSLAEYIRGNVEKFRGKTILVKGSRGIKMEKAIPEL